MANKAKSNFKRTPGSGKPSFLIDTRVIYCGDNLDQLKKFPNGCIDLIYIDPPYNTGSAWGYLTAEEKEDYELRAGIKDAKGLLTKDVFWRKNSKDAGHFNSNWLSM